MSDFNQTPERDRHLFSPGPKRILALDGGGVRGIISLGFLERIETLLRERNGGRENFRLCEHFDLIGGTSTGAILATGLALGFTVQELVEIYRDLSHRAFTGQRWHGGILVPKFQGKALLEVLRRQIGERTLGSEDLRTGLAVIAKRLDTGSPWVFHNNPRARYFNPPEDDPTAIANRNIPLANILRASAAAPTYYKPEHIEVAEGIEGLFVDGGVSPYNNPSLMLLIMASSNVYGYGWQTGPKNLSLLSIGTGRGDIRPTGSSLRRRPSAMLALDALQSMMNDTVWQAQAILQWLGNSPSPWHIDSEAGDLADETPVPGGLLTYQRYDLLLEEKWLAEELGERVETAELRQLLAMDRPDLIERLLDLGRAAAEKQVSVQHLGPDQD